MQEIDQLAQRIRNAVDDEDTEEDMGDLLHRYFEATQTRDWCDVSDVGRGVYKIMYDTEVEDGSPMDAIVSATAAQAADGVFSAIADALGLDKMMLQMTLADWYEYMPNKKYPPSLTPEDFMRRYKQTKEEWEAHDADH